MVQFGLLPFLLDIFSLLQCWRSLSSSRKTHKTKHQQNQRRSRSHFAMKQHDELKACKIFS